MRFVWAYAIEAADGVVLVDAGLDDDGHWANLEAALAGFGATVEDVRAGLFTHYHGDHYGLAERIRSRSGAWIALHEVEADLMARPVLAASVAAEVDRWFRRLGVESAYRPELVDVALTQQRRILARATPDEVLRHGDVVEVGGERFSIVHTPGHSPGHVCIVDEKRGLLFSGDHVLSETTPNVSIFPGTAGSPLGEYLDALDRVRQYDALRALPGHEESPRLGARADDLIAYHGGQLAAIERLLAAKRGTVRDVAEALWRDTWPTLAPIDRHLALGETLAHIVVLERRGAVERVAGTPLRWHTRVA
jgi:glyoxylase-like metal-dependent hydrolase (beta-lactamase superfamily II)